MVDRNGQNADELLPTQADNNTHVSSFHFIFTYFRVLHVKLICRLAVSRAQDEWRASNFLQDIKYDRLHMTVYICGDL